MMGKTHIVGGLCLGVCASTLWLEPTFNFESITLTGLFIASSGIGGLLPDLDCPTSLIGRRVKLISWGLNKAFGHRGFTHTPFFTLLLAFILILLSNTVPETWQGPYLVMTGGLILGYFSHLILDMFTKEGIPALYPLSSKKFMFMKFKTGKGEAITRRLLIGCTGLFILWPFLPFH